METALGSRSFKWTLKARRLVSKETVLLPGGKYWESENEYLGFRSDWVGKVKVNAYSPSSWSEERINNNNNNFISKREGSAC